MLLPTTSKTTEHFIYQQHSLLIKINAFHVLENKIQFFTGIHLT